MKRVYKIILFITFIIAVYFTTLGNYFFCLRVNWNIRVAKSKVLYYEKSEPSFHGDGMKYAVLKYDSDISKFSNVTWQSEKNLFLEEKINKISNYLGINETYLLDFNDDYLYYTKQERDLSTLFMIYMYNQGKIYIIEEIV